MTFSTFLHWMIFGDAKMSLCGRAWERRDCDPFWSMWVAFWGIDHCRRSWIYHKLR